MRFLLQDKEANCGPVVIANAMRWAGYKATRKDVRRLEKQCGTDDIGTEKGQLDYALRQIPGVMVRRVRKRGQIKLWHQMMSHLERGGAVVMGHKVLPSDDYHFILVLDSPHCVLVVNDAYTGRPLRAESETFTEYYRHKCGVWFLYKRTISI